jgi:hypothetical protein
MNGGSGTINFKNWSPNGAKFSDLLPQLGTEPVGVNFDRLSEMRASQFSFTDLASGLLVFCAWSKAN